MEIVIGQKTPCILCKLKFHYRQYKRRSLIPVLSQTNPVYLLVTQIHITHFNVLSDLSLGPSSLQSPDTTTYVYLISPIRSHKPPISTSSIALPTEYQVKRRNDGGFLYANFASLQPLLPLGSKFSPRQHVFKHTDLGKDYR